MSKRTLRAIHAACMSWIWLLLSVTRIEWPCRPQSFLTLAAFVLMAFANSFPQEAAQKNRVLEVRDRPAATLTVHVDEVDLSFVVTDRHHRWVNDLAEDEIRLRDNGQPPESIRLFQSRADLPLRIGLLVDTSDSVTQRFDFEKRAAGLFISQIVDSNKDLAFVLGFNAEPVLAQDLTADTQALADGVQSLVLGGTTAIYDAVNFAYRRLLQQTETGPTRRVLIVLTDGVDNTSHLRPEQIIEDALRYNVVVIVLYTETEPKLDNPLYRVLEKLTQETGGQILQAASKKDMEKAFKTLSAQLRSYYLLAYRPAQFMRDGSFRKIQLKTTRRGAHIICRRGYYASGSTSER